MNYWEECISEALDDVGLVASRTQIETIAWWVEGAHENYGMAHGHDCIPNPLVEENKQLAEKLKREEEKTVCPECSGRGGEMSYGGTLQSWHDCLKCGGRGIASI